MNERIAMKKIYLAGFDVFRVNAAAHGEYLKRICEIHGFTGIFPLDNEAPEGLSGVALAHWIYEANISLIRGADIVMANMNNFRGAEPDSGSCFEIGFAVALGKQVWAYLDDARPLIDQVSYAHSEAGVFLDHDGYVIENFGLSRNLMIACSSHLIIGGPEECLKRIKDGAKN